MLLYSLHVTYFIFYSHLRCNIHGIVNCKCKLILEGSICHSCYVCMSAV